MISPPWRKSCGQALRVVDLGRAKTSVFNFVFLDLSGLRPPACFDPKGQSAPDPLNGLPGRQARRSFQRIERYPPGASLPDRPVCGQDLGHTKNSNLRFAFFHTAGTSR